MVDFLSPGVFFLFRTLKLTSAQISVRRCLQLVKTSNLPLKMTSRRKPATALFLMILLIRVLRGNTLTCHPAEYPVDGKCCPRCQPGSRVKTDCTEFRSTSCLPCLDGTYMNNPTARRECFSCRNCDAGSGLKTKSPCTSILNTVCEPLEGFYCIDTKESSCLAAEKHSTCEPGQYISNKGTASSDTQCSDCSEGTFSDGTFTSCRPHTQCESGNLQLIKPGTAATDAECGEKSSLIVTGPVIGVSVVLFLGLILVVVFVKKKRKRSTGNPSPSTESLTKSEITPGEESAQVMSAPTPETE